MPEILDRISMDLGVSRAWIEAAVNLASANYRRIRVKKRTGGVRILVQPSVEAKMIQYWIMARVLDCLSVSPIATAFEPGRSIVGNARAHSHSLYSVRVDLTDFFPSITRKDLEAVLRRSRADLPEWANDPELIDIIGRTCFDQLGKLPIGYPSSPRIANIVMHEFDDVLVRLVLGSPHIYGKATVTRYADDFVFSTDKAGACKEFITGMKQLLRTTSSPRLRINEKKTRFMSLKGGSTLITGLRVKGDGEVGIHPHYRSYVRLLLKLYSKGSLRREDAVKLRGHLAFVENADPGLFTKWSYIYFSEIAALRSPDVQPRGGTPGESPLALVA